jgi:mannose-6-phosphate isomerase-like protein (cupin superfamily)
MQTADLFGQIAFSTEKMKKVPLFGTDRLLSDLYCFEPGQEQKVHVHPNSDKVYVVLEGQGVFFVGGETTTLRAGQAVLAPAGQEHGVQNPGAERLICFVLSCPPTK